MPGSVDYGWIRVMFTKGFHTKKKSLVMFIFQQSFEKNDFLDIKHCAQFQKKKGYFDNSFKNSQILSMFT